VATLSSWSMHNCLLRTSTVSHKAEQSTAEDYDVDIFICTAVRTCLALPKSLKSSDFVTLIAFLTI
jgi:hypothetical protein